MKRVSGEAAAQRWKRGLLMTRVRSLIRLSRQLEAGFAMTGRPWACAVTAPPQAATRASSLGKNALVWALMSLRSWAWPGQSGIESIAAFISSSSRAFAPPTPS